MKNIIPKIENCPNLYHIEFDISTITHLPRGSFTGWPHSHILKFGEDLRLIEEFGFAANVDIVDFSDCHNLKIKEHAFQRNFSIKECRLPLSLEELPDYTFSDCNNLRMILAPGIKSIQKSTLNGTLSLNTLIFSSYFGEKNLKKFIWMDEFYIDYYTKQTGIVLGQDIDYIYIFSFRNFKFYYLENHDVFHQYDIVTFNHDIEYSYNNTNGHISLFSNFNDYHALNVGIGGGWMSNKYKTTRDNHPECLQLLALQKLEHEFKDKYNYDLRVVVSKAIEKVRLLNIEEIIRSYHTSIDYHYKNKIGGDDNSYYSITRGSSYNDPYINTLLPYYYEETDWIYQREEKLKKYLAEDEDIRKEASARYNQEDHVLFLLKHYIQTLVKDTISIEKYLHISRAKEILTKTSYLSGSERVRKANSDFYL